MQNQVKRWVVLGLVLLFVLPAFAGPTEVDGSRIDGDIYDAFRSNWRQYGQFACEIDGEYAVIPDYNRRFENSTGMTSTQALEHLSENYEERQGNLVYQRVRRPDRADAEALSRTLPGLEIGNYGWIASFEIVEIIDDRQLLVRNVWLIDRDALRRDYRADQAAMERRNNGVADHVELRFNYKTRLAMMLLQEDEDQGYMDTFRVLGFDTRGLQVGDRWDGPNDEGMHVGVVRWEVPQVEQPPQQQQQGNVYRPGSSPNLGTRNRQQTPEPRLVLAPIEAPMRQTLSEDQFKRLLDDRGMTVTAFVAFMREMRVSDRENADQRIMNALLPPVPEEVLQEQQGNR